MTAETCPHHLALDAGQLPDGASEYTCSWLRGRDVTGAEPLGVLLDATSAGAR